MKKILRLDAIILESRFQSRAAKKLDKDHVADLVEAYKGKEADYIDCPRVFEITGKYYLTRGFHRLEALEQAGKKTVECEVKSGLVADALVDAAQSNIGHGLKRTNKDKRRCVKMVLEAHPDWSSRLVSDAAGVGNDLVEEVRQVSDSDTSKSKNPGETEKRTGADGKTYPAEGKKKDDDESTQSDDEKTETEAESEEPEAKKNPAEPYHHDDDIPELPGVYRPLFQRTGEGHEVCLDLHKNPIPDKIGDVFADPTLRRLLSESIEAAEKFEAVHKAVLKMKRSPRWIFVDGVKVEEMAGKIRDEIVRYTDHLREAIPTLACPGCNAAATGCKVCRSSGYISRGIYNVHPEYQKKKRA